MTYWFREGSTDYIVFNLQEDKAALSLEGIDHVVLVLKPTAGDAVSYSTDDASPKLHITSASGGVVELRPASTDFDHEIEPYTGFFKVYETATKWFSVPNEDEIVIRVRSSYGS